MSKLKQPLFSLGAQGSVGDAISVRQSRGLSILEKKPMPTDPQSLLQIYQRWDYQDYVYQWHQLSNADKRTWHSNATRFHMTGFAYFMRDRLKTLPDLAGRWHLDEGSATTAFDSSRNTNNATIFGAVGASALIDGGLYFDGIDDYLQFVPAQSLKPYNFLTLECFARFTDFSSRRPLFNIWGAVNDSIYFLRVALTGQVEFYVRQENHVQRGGFFTTILARDTWYHIAARADSTHLRLFINGQLDTSNYIFNGALNWDAVASPRFGRYGADRMKGNADELRIYNRALDHTEIQRHSARRYP